MEDMDTKQYLSQIERYDKMIQNKLSEIYQLKTMICGITVSNDGERVQASGNKDRLGTTVAKIVDLEKETDMMIKDFVEKRKRIISQIDNIDNVDYYNVLSLRYVSRCTFDEISSKTNWSLRKVFSMHGNALKVFENLYGSEYL